MTTLTDFDQGTAAADSLLKLFEEKGILESMSRLPVHLIIGFWEMDFPFAEIIKIEFDSEQEDWVLCSIWLLGKDKPVEVFRMNKRGFKRTLQ